MKVIDDGWPLHHFRCKKNMTYQDLAIDYKSFLSSSFCYVVFDGYEGASIKDHEHL